ncbi:MAG: molybdopterin molybdotransferase MoeA [Thermoplasmata archaeon]
MAARTDHPSGRRSTAVDTVLARLGREAGRDRAGSEKVPIGSCLGRIPANEIRARRTLPPHDQSTMDGYAVFSSAPMRQPPLAPFLLRVVGRSNPGDDVRQIPPVRRGTAVEVLTGAPMPVGANSIVRSEDCRRAGNQIGIHNRPLPGRDIARRGEDFRPGQRIILAGTPIRPWHIAAFVANEITVLRVVRRPLVGVLSTGDELVPAGTSARTVGVLDTTRPLVLRMLSELGVPTTDLGSVRDREGSIRRVVRRGIATCDVVITTGGSSEGPRDLVPRAVDGLGGVRWLASRLRLRPGSATGVAVVRHRPVFVLPGPPVAAFAAFVSVVEPYLRARGGVSNSTPAPYAARLVRGIRHSRGVREVVRVRLHRRRRGPWVFLGERHGSSRLSSLTEAAGFVVLDERHGDYRRGEAVEIRPF